MTDVHHIGDVFSNSGYGNHQTYNVTNQTLSGNTSTLGAKPSLSHQGHGSDAQELDKYLYQVFTFERVIYLYVWVTLVAFTFFVNILVISVLLRKKMISVTNLIFVAIAISDSMTGLVTLPSYIMVYTTYYPDTENTGNLNTADQDYYEYYDEYYPNMNSTYMLLLNQTGDVDDYMIVLSKSICQGFMISKYFLSRSFHTISIWLTLFLGIQRYISVAYPFKFQSWFTTYNSLILCITIAIMAPILHLYHLVNEKAVDGFCTWKLKHRNVGDVTHLLVTLLLRHLIPCVLLIITTILFLYHLNNNPIKRRGVTSTRVFCGTEERADENRRFSKIVIAIVIVFLIPEVPYAMFIVFTTAVRLSNATHLNDLKRNRVFHAGYEIALIVSFQLNFYIYTFFNKRFRQQLLRMCVSCGVKARRFSMSSVLGGRRLMGGETRNESLPNTIEGTEVFMKSLNK